MSSRRKVEILGVGFDSMTMRDLIRQVQEAIEMRAQMVLAFSNPEFVLRAQSDGRLREYLNGVATLNLPDGVGVVWASRLLRTPLIERVTGTDFVPELVELAAARGYRIYFLGGKPGVAERAAKRLNEQVGAEAVVGVKHGYFPEKDSLTLVEEINSVAPDVLMVCLGNPRQEKWIAQHLPLLKATVVFGNGGALDFWSGAVRRAPMFMQKVGLEWLYRLIQDRSLGRIRRQAKLPLFAIRACAQALNRAMAFGRE